VAHRTPVDLLRGRLRAAPLGVAGLALALIAAWLIADVRTPDLAAQVYRVDLFGRLGFPIWDEHWYAGHHLPGYSLLFPPLGWLLGVRLLGALAALCSALLFERLASAEWGGAGARWAAAWFTVAAVGDLWLGRLAFALGVTFALAAALALRSRRPLAAGALAAVCAAASPVAGVLLALGALSLALQRRSLGVLLVLAGPAAAVVLALALLFPEGGWEPFPIRSFAATAVVVLAFLWALPSDARLLRAGGLMYLLACVLCLLIHSPMGSNVERYGVLLAGPLLLGARLGGAGERERRGEGRGRGGDGSRGTRRALGPAAVLALCLTAVWVAWGPVRETLAVAGSEATSASYYAPLEHFLAGLPQGPVRVEVPLTRSHWEAALLAPSVSLARGWEKQLDTRYDRVLLGSGLSAASYRAWLTAQAVGYVALPDAALDPSSAREGTVIRAHPAYLEPVFASRHWRVYRVLGAPPLLQGPGRLDALGHDSFTITAGAAGAFLVRVRYTRYWTLTGGSGCVSRSPGGWTEVELRTAGHASVAARFSLARAFGSLRSCAGSGAS
jgi:hypothetical protein